MSRRTTVLAAALTVVAALPATAAAAPAAFAPCTDAAQKGWECTTLAVPLDHSGAVPGTVSLRVQRLSHDGPPRGKALVNMEGGPGGSTTARSAQTRRLLADVTARNGYDLVLVDLRATGASTPHALELGTTRFYSTADFVRDLDLVRVAIGVEKLALMGTSYSTLVAAEYARTFPDRTDRLILDSPIGAEGPDLYGAPSAAAAAPLVADLCRRAACPGGPAAVVRDFNAFVAKVRRRPFWAPSTGVWKLKGKIRRDRGSRSFFDQRRVLGLLVAADDATAQLALLPAALRAAARGEMRALGRVGDGSGAEESSTPVNVDINRVTRCLDSRVPWAFEAPAAERRSTAHAGQVKAGESDLGPFTPSVIGNGPIWGCATFGPSGLPTAIKAGAMPAVPGVILQGAWDMRTPPANARSLAAAWTSGTLVLAPATGHGVLRAATGCATEAVDALLGGKSVDGEVCADLRPVAEPLLVAGDAADLKPLPGAPRAVARTAAAIVATLREAQVIVASQAPRGGSMLAGGVEDGWVTATRRAPTEMSARLNSYALFPGTPLDGTLAARDDGYAANVKLGGKHSGRVRVRGGRLTGTIDGRAVKVTLPGADARAPVSRYG